jgi:hypothetical protein
LNSLVLNEWRHHKLASPGKTLELLGKWFAETFFGFGKSWEVRLFYEKERNF